MTAPQVAPEGAWFKSSYSGGGGNNCVEVADLTAAVGIRDSKDKAGPALVVSPKAWASFIDLVRSGEADFSLV
ncbi:DUF397 domain-containing protein [Streptomyces sp. PTM05]|uniref:DUF397 domain-containing protein n=1 Tax=Streptantibioticus parmotrematis TaxID=2873249 RepID=A0ABS7QVM6_9ACTN|nr:DUF397 domain-containing protein [Streptantibioticus parmotrematis]MBY8887271.1 DUF397 domain-containing protein [Streptantibioticus parmotrematis]